MECLAFRVVVAFDEGACIDPWRAARLVVLGLGVLMALICPGLVAHRNWYV